MKMLISLILGILTAPQSPVLKQRTYAPETGSTAQASIATSVPSTVPVTAGDILFVVGITYTPAPSSFTASSTVASSGWWCAPAYTGGSSEYITACCAIATASGSTSFTLTPNVSSRYMATFGYVFSNPTGSGCDNGDHVPSYTNFAFPGGSTNGGSASFSTSARSLAFACGNNFQLSLTSAATIAGARPFLVGQSITGNPVNCVAAIIPTAGGYWGASVTIQPTSAGSGILVTIPF